MNLSYVNKQDYRLGFLQENIELVVYSVIAFFAPFIMGHPQWLVGTIVNSSLVLAGMNLRNYKLLPVIMLPSIAVLARGLIFGPFTILLVYMIPFIWFGNAIFVWSFKYFKLNKWMILGIGAPLKTAFLFGAALLMVKAGILPALFLTTMGALQLYTAIAGGAIALGAQSIKKRFA